jgi:tripartite-type tricarboxylate transporter receptor subunit TctC
MLRNLAILAFGLLSCVSTVSAQEKYPVRPIEFIVPWGPGGGADQVARKVGSLLEAHFKSSFPVLNVPGASGNTGMAKLLAAPNDGYALSVFIADTYAQLATASPKWKPGDYIPLAIMIRQPSGFFVRADGPYKSWNDLVKAAKANPGKVKVGVTGFGTLDDMTVNYFASKGIKMVSVPYAKPGERYAAVLGGHADVLYEQAGDVRAMIDGGKLKPVIFFHTDRIYDVFPDVPASKELGFDIYLPQFRSLIVRAGTDPAKVKVLAEAIEKAANDPEYYAYLKQQWALRDSFIPGKSAQKFMDGELAAMKKVAALLPKK